MSFVAEFIITCFLGHDQYEAYVEERLAHQTSPSEILSSATTSRRPPVGEKSSKQLQLSTLKNTWSLFSRLYIASQVHNGDLDEFFKHENLACPPAIWHMGVLRGGTKSDLLSCLQDIMPVILGGTTIDKRV